ncbi:MAG: S1 RNA-binding domain-containing protein [Planctomycetota bacterium]|nr:MAG: S1 RNA-binding domain-containing protein [Planctomycetota bacterium]
MGSTVITAVIDLGLIAQRLGLPVAAVQSTVELLDGGNTVPFITRYRRDQTGGLDEEAVRQIAEAVARARQLADRKQTILRTIQGQGRLTSGLEATITAAESSKQLEDLYLPFKPRKLSLAEVARQRKLEPLAREILAAETAAADLDVRAADFVDADAQVAAVADVLLGVGHIIAHEFSERADVRQRLREFLYRAGHLKSQRVEIAGKALSKEEKHYRDYFDFSEHIQRVPPHRLLAINRGERARLLKVRVEGPADELQAVAEEMLVPAGQPHAEFLRACARDALARLILPGLEREIRREMTDVCESHAVQVFARNLRNLLLQSPVPGRRVLALDPGFKSGCKAVVIDECGTPLGHAVLHVVGKDEKRAAAAKKIVELARTHGCSVIAIGNGTAGRETETLVAELVAGELQDLDVGYAIVNEAGASVYSTSVYGREELPGYEASIRGAISIGRRLQDPLSELVKIEPANIGVGLYQHDVKARHLHASLEQVVESCVNYVGVDVNTASPALLRRVSGFNQTTAKNFHDWRTKNGPFTSRQQFLEVPGFGDAAYIQSVGFLKISGGINPLDATWIHPESYAVAEQVLAKLGGSPTDLASRVPTEALAEKAAGVDLTVFAHELGVGRLLLADILEQLARPGRDPREDLPKPFFKKGVLKLEDLAVGMELLGSVLNVVDFGAFVDIGMHDSGLVHISQLSSQFVRDPHDVVSVGQIVPVWVLELDKARRRVALTMIPPAERELQQRREEARKEQREQKKEQKSRRAEQRASSPPAAGPGRENTPRPPRQSGQQRDQRPPREPEPRVYQSSGSKRKPPAPLTKEMRDGKEPLRTFGDLKQFLEKPADGQPEQPTQ